VVSLEWLSFRNQDHWSGYACVKSWHRRERGSIIDSLPKLERVNCSFAGLFLRLPYPLRYSEVLSTELLENCSQDQWSSFAIVKSWQRRRSGNVVDSLSKLMGERCRFAVFYDNGALWKTKKWCLSIYWDTERKITDVAMRVSCLESVVSAKTWLIAWHSSKVAGLLFSVSTVPCKNLIGEVF
jgi:hypothetical protein